MIDILHLGITHLDMTDILVEFLQILLTRKIVHLSCSRALCHIEHKGLTLNGLVAVGTGIEISKLHGWNLIMSLMARHHQDIVNLRTLQSIGSQFCLIRNLGIVLIEVLWNIH